jgi:hypothetical protein
MLTITDSSTQQTYQVNAVKYNRAKRATDAELGNSIQKSANSTQLNSIHELN